MDIVENYMDTYVGSKTSNIDNIIFVLRLFLSKKEEIDLIIENLKKLDNEFICYIVTTGGRYGYSNTCLCIKNINEPIIKISKYLTGLTKIEIKEFTVYGVDKLPYMIELLIKSEEKGIESFRSLRKVRSWIKTKTPDELIKFLILKDIKK
ncbi:MAG: hypothetical protein QXP60_05800 [Nitrososphaerota archaeon]